MPCYVEPPSQYEERWALVWSLLQEAWQKPFDHAAAVRSALTYPKDRLAYEECVQRLCHLCRVFEEKGWLGAKSLELQLWWRDHKAQDVQQEAATRETE